MLQTTDNKADAVHSFGVRTHIRTHSSCIVLEIHWRGSQVVVAKGRTSNRKLNVIRTELKRYNYTQKIVCLQTRWHGILEVDQVAIASIDTAHKTHGQWSSSFKTSCRLK